MAVLKNIFISIRPHQWIKNLVIFAAPIFDFSLHAEILINTTFAFCLFCMLSSATYLFNDVIDRERDQLHPLKKDRPITSGALPVSIACVLSLGLLLLVITLATLFKVDLLIPIFLYLFLQLAYNGGIKHLFLLDLIIISAGFVIRAWAGGIASGIEISSWLIITVGFLAFLLGVEKRTSELRFLGNTGTREVLGYYSMNMLNQISLIIISVTILCYSLWAIEEAESPMMIATIPLVVYGLLTFKKENAKKLREEYPEKIILNSPTIMLTIFIWITMTLVLGLI